MTSLVGIDSLFCVRVRPRGETGLVTKSVSLMILSGWLKRGGYCAKPGFRGLFSLKTKKFLQRGALLSEVPFGGQNAIE
jgi:hypothetical protein